MKEVNVTNPTLKERVIYILLEEYGITQEHVDRLMEEHYDKMLESGIKVNANQLAEALSWQS